jgi:curved DNA-binding protein
MKNYYKVLGLEIFASKEDIKKAYRNLAHLYHPDKNTSDEASDKFREINEAYIYLNNDLNSDLYNEEYIKNAYSYFNSNPSYDSFSNGKIEDINLNVFVSLNDILNGCTRTLNISITEQQTVDIKKGIRNNQVITFKEKGLSSNDNIGDLKITIRYVKDDIYKIVQNDIHVNVNVDVYTAILGGTITLNTSMGGMKVSIPRGTQYGDKLRVKGKGIPVYENTKITGDLLLSINIILPTDLIDEEIDLFNKLKDIRKNESS